MAGNKQSGVTLRNTMIERYMNLYPFFTKEEAYDKWKEDMRANASKGGKARFEGKGFAHPDADPQTAGRKGGTISKRKPKNV